MSHMSNPWDSALSQSMDDGTLFSLDCEMTTREPVHMSTNTTPTHAVKRFRNALPPTICKFSHSTVDGSGPRLTTSLWSLYRYFYARKSHASGFPGRYFRTAFCIDSSVSNVTNATV